jgi:type IV secretory pathway VirB3-like protein
MVPPESAATAVALPAVGPAEGEGRWIRDLVFDWSFFIGSTFVVFLVAALFSVKPGGTNLLQITGAAAALNLVIPVLLGGPHIFFSVVRTYMDVDFKREHRVLLRMTPHLVAFSMIYLTFHGHMAAVVNVVLYSAVFHGAAQLAHIGLRYRMKAGRRALDAAGVAYLVAVLAGPLYFVSHALRTRDEMVFVGYAIWKGLAPDAVFWGAGALAVLGAAYWLADLVNHRLAGGRVNWREAAILVATQGAFWFLANLKDLDTTFQAYNAWHSIQALGIMWFAMNAKWRGGKIRGPKQSRFCKDGAFGFTYLWGVVFSVGIGVMVIVFSNFQMGNLTGSPFYFIFAVTVLLNHHALDYWLFFGKRAFDY